MPQDKDMRSCFLLLVASLVAAQSAVAQCNAPLLSPSATVSLPGPPFGVVITPDGCSVFVSLMHGPGAIAVLNRQNGKVNLVRSVPLPASPTGIVLTHDAKLLIAAALDKILFLDVACLVSGCTRPVTGSISTGSHAQSIYANVTPDDKYLFISEERGASITVIDLARARAGKFDSGSVIGRVPVGNAPIALTFSADGKSLFTTSQSAAKSWGWPAACSPEAHPEVKTLLNPEGAVVVIDVARAVSYPPHAVVARIPAGCNPVRMDISPSGDKVYVTARHSNAVIAFDAAKLVTDPEHSRLAVTPVGTAPVPVAVVAGGKLIVAGNSNRFSGTGKAESLSLLDATRMHGSQNADAGTVPAGAFPREMRLSPDSRTLFLTNFGSNSLQVMDVERFLVPAHR